MSFNRIYIDVDGVLADFVARILYNYNTKNGTSYTHEDVTDWGFTDILKGENWRTYLDDRFWADLPALQGASPLMLAVRATGRPYAFLTMLPDGTGLSVEGRREWLDKWFTWFDNDKPSELMIVAARKELVVHPGDLLIDDNPEFIKAVKNNGAEGFLLAQPWNHDAPFRMTLEEIIAALQG